MSTVAERLIAAQALRDAADFIGSWPDDAAVPVGALKALLRERAADIEAGR